MNANSLQLLTLRNYQAGPIQHRLSPMIRHVSIPARDPAHVTTVLAEIMKGRAFHFPGNVPGAYMAVSGDAASTMIEVYPYATTAEPGAGDAPVETGANPAPTTGRSTC